VAVRLAWAGAGSALGGRAGRPQPPTLCPSLALSGSEPRRHGRVRRYRVGCGISQPDQGQVEQLVAQIHVGQESPVPVPTSHVETESNALRREAAPRLPAGLHAVALALSTVPGDFRGIDADQPDAFVPAQVGDVDGVAVGHLRHRHQRRGGRRGPSRAGRTGRDQGGDQGQRDPDGSGHEGTIAAPDDMPPSGISYLEMGRCSKGVDRTTVVRVCTPAFSRSLRRKSSRSAVVRVLTFRM